MDDVTTYAEATYTETMHIAVVPGTRAAMHRFMIPPKPMETKMNNFSLHARMMHQQLVMLYRCMH